MPESTVDVEILTPLPDDTFVLRRLEGIERLSRPFEFKLEVLSGDMGIDFTELVGQAISVKVKPGGEEVRAYNGVILRVGQKGTARTRAASRLGTRR